MRGELRICITVPGVPNSHRVVCHMNATTAKYLQTRAVHQVWPLQGPHPPADVRIVLVVPALAEREHLFETLSALCLSSEANQEKTLVIVVVNNHEPGVTPPAEVENNLETLRLLRTASTPGRLGRITLAWVDAATPGHTLPADEGVGLARKIGLDHGLSLLAASGEAGTVLVSMDADAPAGRGYLDALAAFYANGDRWAGYAAYMHTFPESGFPADSVVAHEIYMRYHEIALRLAGSPYAYPALGSIISCTPQAYAACGGMNRRHAGEDFYFMQQLVKTGTLEPVPYAIVFPSGRTSARTPFGTGRSVAGYQFGSPLDIEVPQICCYQFLRRFFLAINQNSGHSGTELLRLSAAIHPELASFLVRHRFSEVWQSLMRHHTDRARGLHQFHVWFDGLRTIQFLHHLRTAGFPDMPVRNALPTLFSELNLSFSEMSATASLAMLRDNALRRHLRPGSPLPPYSPEVFFRLPATS